MTDKIISKLADIPLVRPGFNELSTCAPILKQLNPSGRWATCEDESLDESKLRSVIQHIIASRNNAEDRSFCCKCAEQNQTLGGGGSSYVPVIMMPIYSADNCPFDIDCNAVKSKEAENKAQGSKRRDAIKESDKGSDKDKKTKAKRGYVIQRLTDFDLMSQW